MLSSSSLFCGSLLLGLLQDELDFLFLFCIGGLFFAFS
jgi:hypothetical protein